MSSRLNSEQADDHDGGASEEPHSSARFCGGHPLVKIQQHLNLEAGEDPQAGACNLLTLKGHPSVE